MFCCVFVGVSDLWPGGASQKVCYNASMSLKLNVKITKGKNEWKISFSSSRRIGI
jgi:hypothetical protein